MSRKRFVIRKLLSVAYITSVLLHCAEVSGDMRHFKLLNKLGLWALSFLHSSPFPALRLFPASLRPFVEAKHIFGVF